MLMKWEDFVFRKKIVTYFLNTGSGKSTVEEKKDWVRIVWIKWLKSFK